MPSLAKVREEMAEKQRQLHAIFNEAGPELDMDKVKYLTGTSEDKVSEIRRRQEELDDLGQKRDRLEVIEQISKTNEREVVRNGMPVNQPPWENTEPGMPHEKMSRPGAISRFLSEHKGFKDYVAGLTSGVEIFIPGVDVKTLITLADMSPQAQRLEVQAMGVESRTVSDLFLQGTTSSNTLDYYEETTLTNNAVEVAEAAEKPEGVIDFTLRTETVQKIAEWIPATRESLADNSVLESWIRSRLAWGITMREQGQVLTGNGTTPNISGILDRSGIQTQAKGADPTPDAIYKAMQLIRGSAGSGFAEPTAVVMHPADWTEIKLLRTADGIYIWGNPSDEGPDRIWGLPVRQHTSMTQNTALVGAFRPHAQIFRREGITITLSTEHASYFIENKVAILAEERLALAVYRPSAFATVTGI